jgi:hypothetical protein
MIKMENLKTIEITRPTLTNRRGMIKFSRELLTENPTEDILKVIFSNFYPVAIENDHSFNMYGKLKMFGYSPHFREVTEGEVPPEYEIIIIEDGSGPKFDKIIEVKTQLPIYL